MDLSEALRPIRSEYWADVHAYVDEAINESSSEEDCWERLDQMIDGSMWVIYTYHAQAVVLVSDNDGAYIDEFGSDGLVTDGALDWSKLAWAAMRADAMEYAWAELDDRKCHACDAYVFGPLPERPEVGPGERVVLTCDDCSPASESDA